MAFTHEILIGDTVKYHGSMVQYHDRTYVVKGFNNELCPSDPDRGWVLVDANYGVQLKDPGSYIHNVHSRSITVIQPKQEGTNA